MTNQSEPQPSRTQKNSEAYAKAIALLKECCTEHGFVATPSKHDNYYRIWGRDSAIIGLAALLSGEHQLIDGCRRSLETLAKYQGPHGEIPSNVDPLTERVSYGGTAGRVDADLWFVICCGQYWRVTGDDDFLERVLEPLKRVRTLLGAWEYNTRGLIYVPPTGDWADEYIQSGYVLYDQLLYYQTQREYCAMHRHLHQSAHHDLEDRATRLKHLIRANYWFDHGDESPDDVYHEVLFEKGRKAALHRGGPYWMPFFSPFGYGYRFDAFANVLVTLFDVADGDQSAAVDRYIAEHVIDPQVMLLPAFHPVISPKDEGWDDLQTTFSYTFKNIPYEYHNGGLWPMVTGFYVASLAKRGQMDLAGQYRDAVHSANALPMNDEKWGFPEFVNGLQHTACGTSRMGWSAAGSVIAESALQGQRLFQEK